VAVVKGPRRLTRAERAAATRARILAVARSLFGTRGYGATTLTQIAAEADVAIQTVYAVFGSKHGILRGLSETVVHDADADAAISETMTSDGPATVASFARSIRLRWEHGYDVTAIHGMAAMTDPAVRADLEAILERRRGGLRRLAERLAPSLDPSVDRDRALAVLDALTLPELYGELVAVHGWTPDGYEAWLAEILARQLLPEGPSPIRPPRRVGTTQAPGPSRSPRGGQ
jgi:AcrR family transcriptional regulator